MTDDKKLDKVTFADSSSSSSYEDASDFRSGRKNFENEAIYSYLNTLSTSFKSSSEREPAAATFIYMIVPPDGGFSWCIMVMTLTCCCLLDGAIFVESDIFKSLEKDMNLTKQETSFISATHLGTYFCLGPFASAFINKFGFRAVAIIGCIIAISGAMIGSCVTNLNALLFTYGTLLGAGGGMAYTSSNLINSYYFEKYRPITAGIVGSGFGVAILIFSPINKILVTELGWRNTIRMHGVLIGVVLILSIFFRPVRPTRVGEVQLLESIKTTESSSSEGPVTKVFVQPDTSSASVSKPPSLRKFEQKRRSRLAKFRDNLVKKSCCPCCNDAVCGKINTMIENKFVIEMGPLDRKDIFHIGQVEYDQSALEASKSEVGKMFTTKDDSVIDKVARHISSYRFIPSKSKSLKSKILVSFDYLFHLGLLKTVEFPILLATAFITNMGAFIPLSYSKQRAKLSPGQDECLLPLIGITTCVFRLGAGFIAYKFKFNVLYLCGCGLLFSSMILFITTLVPDDLVWFQFFYVSAFTAGTASYQALRAILYCDILGLDKLTNAFGLASLALGLGSFTGISIAGTLIKTYGGYTEAFLFAGSTCLVSGILILSLPTVTKLKRAAAARRRR